MDKTRAMPILAGAAMVLSLAACQGMGWGDSESSGTSQSSSAQSSGNSYPYPQSASAEQSSGGQQQAAASSLVRDVQRTLGSRGYDPGSVDGIYGGGTEAALRRFQRDQNIGTSGQIDVQTLAALGLTGQGGSGQRGASSGVSSTYQPTSQRQGAMATPSGRVRDIQQTLSDRGYDPGQVDGRMGPNTRQALRNFQRDQNLQANGRPDSQTLAALGIQAGGGTGTQTGQLPAESQGQGQGGAAQPQFSNPQGSQQQGGQQQGAMPEDQFPQQGQQQGQQQGELPPTGSQAPGSAPESTREPSGIPGQQTQPPATPLGQ